MDPIEKQEPVPEPVPVTLSRVVIDLKRLRDCDRALCEKLRLDPDISTCKQLVDVCDERERLIEELRASRAAFLRQRSRSDLAWYEAHCSDLFLLRGSPGFDGYSTEEGLLEKDLGEMGGPPPEWLREFVVGDAGA